VPTPPKTEPLALVGMACCYAGGISSPEKLWNFVSKGGYFLGEDIALFDPSFFNFTADTAAVGFVIG